MPPHSEVYGGVGRPPKVTRERRLILDSPFDRSLSSSPAVRDYILRVEIHVLYTSRPDGGKKNDDHVTAVSPAPNCALRCFGRSAP